jgi:radical SAM superfamily enzyme YgiQ (UPF0313 family)
VNVLFVAPRFVGPSFWNMNEACEVYGVRVLTPPLALITVAAMLPPSWECRLINRNAEELRDSDLEWADLVMTGGMIPQRIDILHVVELAHAHGKPVAVGGPDVTSVPELYESADFRVLGEAEGIIDDFIEAWDSGIRLGVFEAEKFTIDISKTPIPRFDLLNQRHYAYFGVQFARGCPFTCEFCDIIELYGRVPRVKTAEQMLAELDALYRIGYRGQLDFVDDNFIGNKKAVKALLPHLIAWQKERGYPFLFSTEASINLADDDALLALMRDANFFAVFVGIESPDTETLVSMQKKQNTRRALSDSIHKIYRSGIFVTAGFILGFDTEKGSIAESMIECIEATAIPIAIVGLLSGLPGTQLTRRLAREGRLYSLAFTERRLAEGAGDQCVAGLNFETIRPRRDILVDYRAVLKRVYSPGAFYRRLRTVAEMLERPKLNRRASRDPRPRYFFGISQKDIVLLWRLVRRLAVRQPLAVWPFARLLYDCVRKHPRSVHAVGMMTAGYLHVGPFSRFVIRAIDQQIAEIDSGRWDPPIVSAEDLPEAELAPRSRVGRATALAS